MADKLEIILRQLPTKLTTGQLVFIVASSNTPDVPRVEELLEKLNENGEWIRLKVGGVVRENEVPPQTAVIVLMTNVIEGTILQMKKRARNRNYAACCCLSATLTKNQVRHVLERLDQIREKLPVTLEVGKNSAHVNGSGQHSSASKSPFVPELPTVSLADQPNGRSPAIVSESVSSEGEPQAEVESAVDPEAILKSLDELPAAAAAFMKTVSKAQDAVILLSTQVDELKLRTDELSGEKAALEEKNCILEEEKRVLSSRLASMETELADYAKLKMTLAPLAHLLTPMSRS